MKLDFIGHEIRDEDELWIIKSDLTRIEAKRVGDKVIPIDKKFSCLEQILHDGKNSKVDLQRNWLDEYMIKNPLPKDNVCKNSTN